MVEYPRFGGWRSGYRATLTLSRPQVRLLYRPHLPNTMAFTELNGRRYWLSIAGTMGVGKSTLAQLLLKEIPKSVLLPEKYDKNPYLKDYYKDPFAWAYLSQLWFLRTKAQQIKTIPKKLRKKRVILQDTPLDEDALAYATALHAEGKISDEHWEKYLQEFNHFAHTLPHPALLIYLAAPTEMIMQRIERRGRDFEAKVDPEYIQQLNEYNEGWVREYPWPILQITTDALNLVDNPPDQQLALRMIQDRLQRLFPPKKKPVRTNNHGPVRRLRGRR